MRSEVHPLNSYESYKYVVVLSEFEGQLLLSRHRARRTWETQGGHIEPGETPMDAAKRELYEESGATDFDITPLFDYFVADETGSAVGVVFFARIRTLAPLPESEMAEVRSFPALPDNLTYPGLTPTLFAGAQRRGYFPDLH